MTLEELRERAISKEICPSVYTKNKKGYFINFNEYTNDGCQRCKEVTKKFYESIMISEIEQ